METSVSRVERSKEDARSSYNHLSRWYDALSGSSEKKFRDQGLEKLSAHSGERILEIGQVVRSIDPARFVRVKQCGVHIREIGPETEKKNDHGCDRDPPVAFETEEAGIRLGYG